MTDSTHRRETVEQLAEEFADRYRRGERPSIDDYAAAHPEHAAEIRDLFPALVMMEELAPSDAASSDSVSSDHRPVIVRLLDRIGDYRILREVGRGGMGVRRVALKVLPLRAAGDPKHLARFRRESRAAAQLHHTNIVPVFEVGQDGDHCYYAMQFIPGQALDEVLNELRSFRDERQADPGPITQSLLAGGCSPSH
jgi:eukaryotic-like serine/threonine-protein kinase